MTAFGWSTCGALGFVVGYYGWRWHERRKGRR